MNLWKTIVTNGVAWVDAPEADLRVLCGTPADSVKHLMRAGLIGAREKDGVRYESGPNAILLSDVSVQNGGFSNLAEFPILQMFYRQGMLIPGHPGNDGGRPLIIGLANQLKAQLAYIDMGKTGIMDEKTLAGCGLTPKAIRELLELKTAFSFGDTRKASELVDVISVERDPVELKGGVTLRRTGLNLYEFSYRGETVSVDLNLSPGETYRPAVVNGFHELRREYFAVAHVGEGDGWNPERQCMGSILFYQGKVFLIDTGPNILGTLTSLGLGASDIEGVFQTHAHDDHFAGLPTLARGDHRIRYHATALVRASVTKKACALMAIPESRFSGYFDAVDLAPGRWNDLDGLEVMPVPSPHPVETCAYYFRTMGEGGYRTYAHLADIISSDALLNMVAASRGKLDPSLVARTMKSYLAPADVKKVDAGGGMIHGSWKDFLGDASGKIYLSHCSGALPAEAGVAGQEADFGSCDVLIPARQDYTMQAAARFLAEYFPESAMSDRYALLNCPVERFAEGDYIVRESETASSAWLLVSGVVELICPERGVSNLLPAGTFLGEQSVLTGAPSTLSYRAVSIVRALRIPAAIYVRFLDRGYGPEETVRFHEHMLELKTSRVFGDMISSSITAGLARGIRRFGMRPGDRIEPDPAELVLVHAGTLVVFIAEAPVDRVGPGGIFGEEGILLRSSTVSSAVAETEVEAYAIPSAALERIPAIEWKLLETYERRINAFGAFVS